MADNNMVLGIELGNTDAVLNSMSDIDNHLENIANRLKDIEDSDLPDAIAGGDRQAIKSLLKETNLLSKDFQTLQGHVKKWKADGTPLDAEYVEGLDNRLKGLTDTTGELGQTLVEGLQNAPTWDASSVETLSGGLEDAERKVQKLLHTMATTDDIDVWKRQERDLRTATMKLETFEEGLEEAEKAQRIMANGAGQLITEYSAFDDVIGYLHEYNEATNFSDNSLDRLNNQIGELQGQYAILAEQAKKVNDPAVLEVIAKQQEGILEDIEKQTEELDKQRKLQRSVGKGSGRSGDASKAFGDIAGVSGSLAGLVKNMGDFDVSIQLVDNQLPGFLSNYTGSMTQIGQETVKLSEIIQGVSQTFEEAQANLQRAGDLRNEITGIGDRMGDWSKRIQASNKALVDSGKNLNRFQKGLGNVAGGVGKFSGVVQGLGKVVGVAGAAIAGLQAGFAIFDTLMGRSSEQIDKRIGLIREEFDRTKALNQLIKDGSTEAVKARIASIEEEIETQRKLSREIQASAVENTDTFSQIRTIMGATFFNDTTIYGRTGDELKNINEGIKGLEHELSALTEPTFQASVAMAELRKQMQDAAEDVMSQLARREEELFDARVDIVMKEADLRNNLIEIDEEFAEETERINEAREQQDKEALRNHLAEMSTMEEDYQRNVRSVTLDHHRELRDMEEDYLENLADQIQAHNENMDEMRADFDEANAEALANFREEEAESQEDYNKRLAKMEEDFNKEKIKRQKDLEAQLFEAEIENDALRYFMLQRQGEEEEKEAEAQYQEQLDDEKKAFKEAKDERLADYLEQKKERAEQYKEERAEAQRQHAQNIADAKAEYDEQRALAQEQQKQRLADMEYEYSQERMLAAKAFKARQEDMRIERAKEDNDRLDRVAERRQELEDAFQLELDYFNNREETLTKFIEGLTSIDAQKASLQGIAKTQPTEITASQYKGLRESIQHQIKQLRENAEAQGGMDARTQELIHALGAVEGNLVRGADAGRGGYVDLSEGINLQRLADNTGVTFEQLLGDAINDSFATATTELESEMRTQLTYFSDAERQAVHTVKNIEETGEQVYDTVYHQHLQSLDEMGLLHMEAGLQRSEEFKTQMENDREILKSEGKETLEELQQQVEEEADLAIEKGTKALDAREESLNNELQSLIESNTAREQNENQFREDIETATQMAYDQAEQDENAFRESEKAIREGTHDALAEMDESAKEGELERETGHQDNLDEQAEEHLENDITRREEHQEAIIEQEQLEHEAKLLRMEEQFELESQLWTQFMADLEKNFTDSSRDMVRGIQRETQKGTQNIVNQHGQMINAIVQAGAKGLNSINQYVASAQAKLNSLQSRSSSSSSSSSGGSGYTGSSYGSYSQELAGLAAAKGAFIDRPTALIAGEGESPELVMPFDESKGIPDNVAREFALALTGSAKDDRLGVERIGGMDNNMMAQMLVALREIGNSGHNLSINTINVGSNISRQEIREQMGDFQQVVVDVMNETINVQ